MGWFARTFTYSIGKKLIMALTGLFLVIFLLVHLFGNVFLYVGKDAFNAYVHTLNETGLKIPIKILEVFLALGFLFHMIDGVTVWIQNRIARGVGYKIKKPDPESTFASRNMIISALLVFVFLVIHLRDFWYAFHYGDKGPDITDYDIVVGVFHEPIYVTIYLVAMVLLGLHLYHGFQSAFQTLGLNHKKYTPFIVWFGRFYAIFVSAAFASFPIYFFFFVR